ncbi:MAG: pyridoxal kinase [Prolixibacteraceae bacterium]
MNEIKRNIITVQSQVASGYVGNNIAALAIQLHGFDPVQLPTVLLSNHIEYPEVYGMPIAPELITDLFKGIKANHFVEQCNFLISGFCYDREVIFALTDFIKGTKAKSEYRYVYDPAFGDSRSGGLYIDKKVANHSIAKLLPLSDIITPNHFEMEYILGKKINTKESFLTNLSRHEVLHSKTVIVTNVNFKNTPKDTIEVALFKQGTIEMFTSAWVPFEAIGTGDLFTAIMTSQLNQSKDISTAILHAMDFIRIVLTDVYEHGDKDLNAKVILKHAHLLL